MKIGIVSDTHGRVQAVDTMLKIAEPVDLWLHAGDVAEDAEYLARMTGVKTLGVLGNCDWPDGKTPLTRVVDAEEHRIFLAHGHASGIPYTTKFLREEAAFAKADIIVFGHSHQALIRQEEGMLLLNPGSLAKPRDGHQGSFMILTIAQGEEPSAEIRRLPDMIDR